MGAPGGACEPPGAGRDRGGGTRPLAPVAGIRRQDNPNGDHALRKGRPTEFTVETPAGSVLVFDGRLWHTGGNNRSLSRRVFRGVNYGPWWLNCHARRPHSVEHRLQDALGHTPSGHWPYLKGGPRVGDDQGGGRSLDLGYVLFYGLATGV